MQAATELCRVLEIEILPTNIRRRPMQTHAGGIIEWLIRKHGLGHATITLRAIVESIGNETEVREETICAISDIILARPDWANRGVAFIEAFDDIDLKAMRAKAKALKIPCPSRFRLGVLLHEQLARIFETSPLSANTSRMHAIRRDNVSSVPDAERVDVIG
jgi:hypothetical protein